MPQLPRMSGREVVRVFQKHGWEVARQRGSHIQHGQSWRERDTFNPGS